MKIKSFQRWCEDNGRLWTGHASFNDFKRTAEDYEKYRKKIKDEANSK
tara:strand:+ start:89 stop:232 length:144 start_codon:yes stop_codon:yes gene_type:complete